MQSTKPEGCAPGAPDAAWVWDLLERLNIGVLRVGPDGNVALSNEAMARMFGAGSAREMLGRPAENTYADPRERAEAVRRLSRHPHVLEHGFVRIEAQRKRYDNGKLFDVLLSLVPGYDDGGRLCTINCLVENLGDRRGTEKAFRSGEERFRTLFETTAVAMALSAPDGRIQRSNPALQRFLAMSADALVERELLELVHDEDREAALPLLASRGPTSPDEAASEASELRFRRADGSLAWGAVSVSWLVDDGVAHTRVVSIQDISRRKHMEEALLCRQKLDAVGRLAGGIAHDFNNILTVIQGNLALVEDDAGLSDATRDLLRGAEKSVRRAQDLSQQLITFAEGGSPLKRTVSLADLVREVGTLTLTGTTARFEIDVAPDLLPSDGDPGQLAQVFHHVFQNAVEAMPAGGSVRARLCNEVVSAETYNGLPAGVYLRVDIEDQGIGIPEPQLEHVFDPYFSTKRPGGGLGLAIVLSIIRRHGGHAAIRSRMGFGTVVTLLVPACTRPLGADVPPHQPPRDEPCRRRRVLVMDDDADLLELERRILARAGFDVETATDGETAVEAYAKAQAAAQPFDLVVLDLTVVGGMGGLEALGRIRGLDPTARAIVCSGYSNDPVMADPRAHGFDGIVPKPFTPAHLQEEARRVSTRTRPG